MKRTNQSPKSSKCTTTERLLKRLRELRKCHGLTQKEFSKLAGMSQKYYQLVESGRRPQLRLPTLIRLAKPYGLEVVHLFSPEFPKTKFRKT
jgi:transcriptional regulator with XRE-family HTH domain